MTLECLAKIGLASWMSRSKVLPHLMNPSLIPRAHSEDKADFQKSSDFHCCVVALACAYSTPKLACECPALFFRRYKLTKENDALGSTSGYG